MIKYTPKNQLKVDGKMSTEGADFVGRKLAWAAFILAICGGFCLIMLGISFLF